MAQDPRFYLTFFDWADDGTTLCSYPQEEIFENLDSAVPFAETFDDAGAVLVLLHSFTDPLVYKWVRNVGWSQLG
jgi:hypothetical protein